MAEMKVDRELVLAIPFMLGSLVTLDILAADSLQVVDLAYVWYAGHGMTLQTAHLLQIVPLAMIVINRDQSFVKQIRALGAIEAFIVYVTVGLVIAPPFLPELAGTVAYQPLAFMTFAVQTIGLGIISFIN